MLVEEPMFARNLPKLFGWGTAVVALLIGLRCGGSGNNDDRTTGAGGSGGSGTGTGGSAGNTGGTVTNSGGSTGTGGAGTGGGTGGVRADAGSPGTDVCPLPTTTAVDALLYDGVPPGATCLTTLNAPRNSFWFGYDDATSDGGIPRSVVGAFGGCGGASDCAIHATGSGFTNYGAGMGFDLRDAPGPVPVDATPYMGIQFSAKGTITGTRGPMYASSPQTIHVKFVDPTVRAGDDFGGYCSMLMNGTWTVCNLAFAALTRDGFGNTTVPVATDVLDRGQLLKIQFEFSKFSDPPDSGVVTPVGFDFWIDNISFY
jgi:hypothetical protein